MKEESLDKLFNKKDNNLSLIKFLLAFLVIFSHAFPITNGPEFLDPINILTNGQLDLGNFSVCIFLFFSGFLITSSLLKSKDGSEFFKKRVVRIIPPLFIVVMFTAFIVGPIFTTVSMKTYFSDYSPYLYVLKNTFLITTHNIVGLWANNPYNLSANGSLWTLPVEFLCYIACFIFLKIKLLNKKNLKYTLIPFAVVFILQNILYNYLPVLEIVLPLFMLFYMGMLYYIYMDDIDIKHHVAILCILITIISLPLNLYGYIKIITLPYIFLWMAFKVITIPFPKLINKIFKLSYEIYLLGFVVQQIICYLINNGNPYINFGLSIIPTIILAYGLNVITPKLVKRK